jgi:hypothetical protein
VKLTLRGKKASELVEAAKRMLICIRETVPILNVGYTACFGIYLMSKILLKINERVHPLNLTIAQLWAQVLYIGRVIYSTHLRQSRGAY